MATPLSLTAIYEPVEDGWVQARVRELPEVITVAPSLDAAKVMLEDAVREYLMALTAEGNGTTPGSEGEASALEVTIRAAT